MSQSFTTDGVHLTADSGRTFMNMLLYNAENFFETEAINLEEDQDKRRFNSNLVMARLREDMDAISNGNKEDKMIITGYRPEYQDQPERMKLKNG
jgi:hypothetical protein